MSDFGGHGSLSAPEKLSESKKSVLIQRVSDRWQCLERNDYECAYEFTSPAYRRVFSREMYVNRYFSQTERVLTGVKLVAYDRDAAVASVRVGVMSGPLKNAPSASRGIAVTPLSLDESLASEAAGNGGTTKARKTGGVNSLL